ncbi:sentrin-specific protease 7 isoform X1 [Pipistrellus kuhlii]|uniref:Sentrin-specific protease 7 n=3 Tax=Pipistrellus kuhlii TaxID=59472 RepID=A0A7J8ABH2_PIPKU|nr:sentrin-specific protease 7 isoform X1 [Pipistrellus kuhlii]KAF6383585.1 SUMO specific peptidase 7 [Pipistrellus kuhlii]
MDRRKAGRRRSSPEIVTEGKRKKTSSSELHKITKILDAKPEDARVKPPLSKLRSSERWDLPLQGWERSRRNNVLSLDCKSKKGVRGRPVTSKTSSERQLKVMLTNVLWTELGRKFRKILPRNDANLCDANKVQSDSLPSTSVDSLETCQKLEPLHQSLKLSERIPRVILTNVLGTDLGRKYIKTSPVTEATLGDTDNLQSEQLSSSSDDSLESCQNLNPHKSFFLNERGSQSNKTVDKNCSRRATQIKEKRKGNDGISLVVSDTQSKDLNSESRGCDHLEEGSRNKNGTCSDSKMEPTLISRKRKKRLRSNSPDSHNSTSLYKPAELTKEQENDSTVSSEFEKLNENHDQNPKLLKEITPEPMESDFTELSSLDSQELALSAAPKSTSDCSVTETVVENSVSTDTLGNTTQVEKDENKMNTIEKPVLSEHSEGNQSLISAEPIVVSSDEEGPIEHKNSEILKLQSKQDHNVTKENESISESALSELPSITCESVQASSELCPAKENISCIMPSNEMDLQLDFIFTSVYIGKIKGASKGCVTFTPKYVKIPFQVSLNEVLLLVDTTHLKRFGLWKSKDDDHSKRSLAILFLWVSSHYLQDIQTQLENSMLSQQSKSSEFIFLELHNPISQREELKLKDIMTEISTTTGEVELSYPLSWVQAFPLFQNLSSKESSFIHYYCASTCSFFAAAAEEIKMQSVSQPSNVDAAKPNYTFLQKQSSGCYSLSITTNPDEEWREVRHTGPVQKLIVYPPPPTKGGLGVTSEDLECLEEGEFLNDVIIDFYLKYLILEKASNELGERSHIFSSFFYKCLTRKEKNLTEDNPDLSMAQRRHRRVRTWTRNINIFNKDYIFVPVNESSHWYLAVICFPWLEEAVYEDFPQTISQQSQAQQSQHNKTIDKDLRTTSVLSLGTVDSQSTETSMSIPKKVCKRPCILILDSLKAASIQNTVQNLREYLEVEWEVKRKTHREFSKTNMVDLCPKVPKQDNSSDCGVYLLQYVESFFKDPIVNFELPIHLEKWFPRHVIKTKREDIRELILKLHLQQQKASSS